MASEADASRTSDSVICPTPLWIIFTDISSVESFSMESDNASIDPSTSPFKTIFSSLKFPSASLLPISSKVTCFFVLSVCSLISCSLLVAISLASLSVSNILNLSPACGAPLSPSINIGVAGPTLSFSFP